MQGLIGQGEEVRFYSKCNEKLLGSLKHKRDIMPFMLLKDDSGCCVVNVLYGGKSGNEESIPYWGHPSQQCGSLVQGGHTGDGQT